MNDRINQTTALHEAGHALVFVRLFPEQHGFEVTIRPDIEARSQGHCSTLDVSTVSIATPVNEAERAFRDYAIFCCAGYAALIAQGYGQQDAELGCESDFEEAGRYLDHGKREAVKLLSQPENIEAAKLLAQELLENEMLRWDEVEVIVSVADGETTQAEYEEFKRLVDTYKG